MMDEAGFVQRGDGSVGRLAVYYGGVVSS